MGSFFRWAQRPLILLLVAGGMRAAGAPDESPLALVLGAAKATVERQGVLTPLAANPGTVLFSGDTIQTADGEVTFISCVDHIRHTLSAKGDVIFESRGPKLRKGSFTASQQVAGCYLPPLPRAITASQQDAGAAVSQQWTRDLSAKTFEQRLHQLPDAQSSQLVADMAPLGAALRANPDDPLAHLARAYLLSRSGLSWDAAEELKAVVKAWPDAAWARSRSVRLEENAARGYKPKEQTTPEGQTFALLVGISKFQDPAITALHYAHEDALELEHLMESPRLGGIPKDNIVHLVNEKATRAAIQSAIETQLLARAGPSDTVVLFIASHGMTVPVQGEDKGFIVAYDSTAKELATTGIPMEDIQSLFDNQLTGMKRLMLYVDVCYAGAVGEVKVRNRRTMDMAAKSLPPRNVQVFGLLGSQANELSLEGPDYGGGHGAFSYFLMDGLNGRADELHHGTVAMSDLSLYVTQAVRNGTDKKQVPKQIGTIDDKYVLADLSKPGIDLKAFTGATLQATRRQLEPDADEALRQFHEAIEQGRIVPTDDRNAFALLPRLRAILPAQEYQAESEKLRVALEDAGQQVLLRYLAGEAVPQDRSDFLRGSQYFEAAKQLSPDSVYLDSRDFFCRGRVAIFEKDYRGAATLLERAVGLDPQRAYAYNGLGIAALEQADYDRAILAFRDAASRAPYWPYALHNLALAYTEKGDYENAIQTYRLAMKLAPHTAYVAYNLGLLYERLNRSAEAESMYRQALTIEPDNALALNALGTLRAAAGHSTEAEKYYRQALKSDPTLLAARHDLAILLAGDSKRIDEAIGLWNDNLARDPKHLPSLLGLAGTLAQSNRAVEAAGEYEKIIALRPDYAAARMALADVYVKAGEPQKALAHLEQALKVQPDNPAILEKTAGVYLLLNRTADARAEYQRALDLSADGAARKRIRAALKKTG